MIKEIVFDCGHVLINVKKDPNGPLEPLKKYSTIDSPEIWKKKTEELNQLRLTKYYRGELTPEEFLNIFKSKLSLKITTEELQKQWTEVLFKASTNNELCDIIEKILKKTHLEKRNLHILSNVDEIHWRYWQDKIFPERIYSLIQGRHIASYKVAALKPTMEIYYKAHLPISIYKCVGRGSVDLETKPNEVLFIDDLQENIDGAKKFGWNAILWPSEKEKLNNLLKIDVI